MVKQKDTGPVGAGRTSAAQKVRKKNRHYNDRGRPHIPGLVARPAVPKSKHKTILEWTENTDKKKKLEIEFTTNKNPNANFSFVPIGNPELTSMCKELSREQGALVYIVSTTKEKGTDLSDHVHRIGYHFRTLIVEQATTMLEGAQSNELTGWDIPRTNSGNKPGPIPESQEEINKQADAAIRDLFPRIPNTDREMIVRHAFQKGAVFNGKPVVGLQADLTLSRRVQLAVIAHIRHTHTRYDILLKETSWENARRTVESLCLDILVKWRGDEETGRDQLDEVLREIVVIDDSDDEDDEEGSEEGSASEDEEADSSDGVANGVAAANLENTKHLPHISPQELLAESQSRQVVTAQTNNSPQIPGLLDPSQQNHGISSRTRSKTKPSHRHKAKKSRRNKRFQAWQDALRRRGERPSAPRTPFEQPPRASMRGMDESPRLTLNRTPLGPNNSDLYTAPYNDDYQTIYAIENGRGLTRSATYLTSSRRVTGPPEFNYRERMLISPQTHNAPTLERRQGYDVPRPQPIKPLPFRTSGLQQSYAPSRRDIPSEDMALPSIEPPTDLTNDSPRRVSSYVPIRHPQVMYQEVEPERRYLPIHTDTTYVSNWEDNQPKRRRVVLADDLTHGPVSSSTTDGYIRFVPISRSERPAITAPSSRHILDFRDDRERHDVPIIIDRRPEYLSYTQRATETRDQDRFSSMTNMREPAGVESERRLITGDDSPHVRMVRRPPGHIQSYSGQQYATEPQKFESQRAGDQRYFETIRPTQSMQDPTHERNRRVESTQPAQQVIYARAPPRYQHEEEQGSSSSLSAFLSHPHSSEVNAGLVSYPKISRPHYEYASRFPSTRDEPILVSTKTSHQLPPKSFTADNFERHRPQGREENRRPVDYEEASPVARHYLPTDPQGRFQQVEPHYIPIDPPEMARRVVRERPANATGLNEPTYVRRLPYRDEVIVLSP